jgi:FkbM family methyltransferase
MKIRIQFQYRLLYLTKRIFLVLKYRISGFFTRLSGGDRLDLNKLFIDAGVPREPWETGVVRELAKSLALKCVVDIGANHGEFSSELVDIVDRVVLIEPNTSLASYLTSRFSNCKQVEVVNAAVMNNQGDAYLVVPDGHSGAASIVMEPSADDIQSCQCIKIHCVTLASVVLENDPDFIKIDVEGHELAVISTISAIELNRRGVIIGFECSGIEHLRTIATHLSGYEFYSLQQYWPGGERGFRFLRGCLAFLFRSTYGIDRAELKRGYQNMVFAVPRGSAAEKLLTNNVTYEDIG